MSKITPSFVYEMVERWDKPAWKVAKAWSEEFGLSEALAPYKAYRFDARRGARPVLHLEDVTGIPFVGQIPGVEEYQHRARVRARTGDIFASVTEPAAGYEDYSRAMLGLGAPELLLAEPAEGDSPMAVAAACGHGAALERLVEVGRRRGGLVLHPYMSIEPVWELARRLAAREVDVEVVGPPPPALWVANDKARLAEVINRLAEGRWNVETYEESTPEALAGRLRELAGRHRRVGLKRTRCASAMGNIVWSAASVAAESVEETTARVAGFLQSTDWEVDEPVLAVEWADTDHSPSTQLWIPEHGQGAPRLDGVYEQLLKGEERVFVGSRPSTLPAAADRALVEASMAMALVFQRLGYVGRCSFDFILTGDLDADVGVKMTECNGRWGGTSTPMVLVDRLVKGRRPHYIAQDFDHAELVGASFEDVLAATREQLFDPATGRGRFAFYNVGPLRGRGKLDVVSLGETPEEALAGVEVVLPGLLGLS